MSEERKKPITLKTKSFEQWSDERLIKAGYERQADGSLAKDSNVCGVPMRHTLRRVDGGYASNLDALFGLKVIE